MNFAKGALWVEAAGGRRQKDKAGTAGMLEMKTGVMWRMEGNIPDLEIWA